MRPFIENVRGPLIYASLFLSRRPRVQSRPVEPMAEVREIRKIGFSPPLPLRPRQNTFTSPGPTTKANLNALNTASSWRVTRTLPPLTGCRGCLLIDWQANNRCIYQEDSDSVGSKKGSTVVQYLTTSTLHPPSLRSRLQTTQAVHRVTPEWQTRRFTE